jgi:hypothetical protein
VTEDGPRRRTTAEDYFGTFFDEASDDAFSDSSGAAGNDRNLIF